MVLFKLSVGLKTSGSGCKNVEFEAISRSRILISIFSQFGLKVNISPRYLGEEQAFIIRISSAVLGGDLLQFTTIVREKIKSSRKFKSVVRNLPLIMRHNTHFQIVQPSPKYSRFKGKTNKRILNSLDSVVMAWSVLSSKLQTLCLWGEFSSRPFQANLKISPIQ